jgi:predicted amidohydrolase
MTVDDAARRAPGRSQAGPHPLGGSADGLIGRGAVRPTRIAAVQMVSTPSIERNLAAAERLIADAARAGAELVALPEYFCLMGINERAKIEQAEAPGDGAIQRFLAAQAKANGIWLVGGTLPLKHPGAADDKVRNSCGVYAPDGTQAARYDKLHLFHYDNGRERYDEGSVLEAGSEPVALQAGALRLGLSVCYDLRFPELYRALMRDAPCDLLAVPAAFTTTTGKAHWSLLLRARAVENQCYVIAPAQGGTHENGRRTWGHSMIVDPWGEVLAERSEDGEGVIWADVDPAHIAAVRQQLPALAHRRL